MVVKAGVLLHVSSRCNRCLIEVRGHILWYPFLGVGVLISTVCLPSFIIRDLRFFFTLQKSVDDDCYQTR